MIFNRIRFVGSCYQSIFLILYLILPFAKMSNVICQSKLDLIANSIASGNVITKVDLSNCNLSEFPLQLLLPCKETIEMINLGGNSLSTLPEEISEFKKLRILFFAQNKFDHIPEVLGLLPALYMLSFKSNMVEQVSSTSLSPSINWLILTDNKISGKCLEYLFLHHMFSKLQNIHTNTCLYFSHRTPSYDWKPFKIEEIDVVRKSINFITSRITAM